MQFGSSNLIGISNQKRLLLHNVLNQIKGQKITESSCKWNQLLHVLRILLLVVHVTFHMYRCTSSLWTKEISNIWKWMSECSLVKISKIDFWCWKSLKEGQKSIYSKEGIIIQFHQKVVFLCFESIHSKLHGFQCLLSEIIISISTVELELQTQFIFFIKMQSNERYLFDVFLSHLLFVDFFTSFVALSNHKPNVYSVKPIKLIFKKNKRKTGNTLQKERGSCKVSKIVAQHFSVHFTRFFQSSDSTTL